MKITFKPSAIQSIESVNTYLAETILMPETGIKYALKMLSFANTIAITPNAFSICKKPSWKRKELRCATFDKTWVFAFKITQKQIVIYYIKNGKLLNY